MSGSQYRGTTRVGDSWKACGSDGAAIKGMVCAPGTKYIIGCGCVLCVILHICVAQDQVRPMTFGDIQILTLGDQEMIHRLP